MFDWLPSPRPPTPETLILALHPHPETLFPRHNHFPAFDPPPPPPSRYLRIAQKGTAGNGDGAPHDGEGTEGDFWKEKFEEGSGQTKVEPPLRVVAVVGGKP